MSTIKPKEATMKDQRDKDLARKARTLYMLTQNMQKTMLEMFLDEFIDLDEEEERMKEHPAPISAC
jgi:hypothetical protein